MKRLALAALAALSLAACATPTVYQPAASATAVGYTDYRIEPGRYRIKFRGGGGADGGVVMDLALRRAADLAVRDGYDWFRVVDRFMASDGYSGSSMSVGVGGGSGSWGYHGGSAGAVGVGTSFPLGGGPVLTATLEVMMGKGPRPAAPDVYDAHGVQAGVPG